MAFLSVIRRWALREGMSIREIARRTGLSRNTIRKYLRNGTTEPSFKVPDRPSKLDPYAEKLSGWLLTESRKPRKQRRTIKQLHRELVVLGYTGSYGRVAAFARAWQEDRRRDQQTTGRGTFVPLVFQPGEAFQFDWSENWAVIGDERIKLQVAHIKLSHSRAFLLRAYLLQSHEMLFDAHWHGFRVFGGVPRAGSRARVGSVVIAAAGQQIFGLGGCLVQRLLDFSLAGHGTQDMAGDDLAHVVEIRHRREGLAAFQRCAGRRVPGELCGLLGILKQRHPRRHGVSRAFLHTLLVGGLGHHPEHLFAVARREGGDGETVIGHTRTTTRRRDPVDLVHDPGLFGIVHSRSTGEPLQSHD